MAKSTSNHKFLQTVLALLWTVVTVVAVALPHSADPVTLPVLEQPALMQQPSGESVETVLLAESVRYGLGSSSSGQEALMEGGVLKYEAPDDCQTIVNPLNQEVKLICNLRTVNSEFETTNFSVIPSEHTVSLTIVCDNEIMARSTFRPNSFVHLTRLRELVIVNCKVDRFAQDILFGLNQLQNLTVQSKNFNLNLVVEAHSFSLNRRLQQLDLSLNNIWQLPDHLFCALTDLTHLNVSGNRLQDLNELSFIDASDASEVAATASSTTTTASSGNSVVVTSATTSATCNVDLEVLDVSSNQIVLLPALGLGKLKRLKELSLANNEISMLADKAFGNLKMLRRINLNSNKIVALPSELFQDAAASVQEIYLRNNSITALSPNLFANLEQLLTLDLSQNQISSMWLNKETFSGLIRLVLLNLSQNKIHSLNEEMFADLYSLQILNLRFNQIENLPANTFSTMPNLHTLLLSNNKIKYLDGYSLNGLFVLSLLSLDNNQLTGIHPEAFRNCSSLQDLNLNGNQMKAVPLALKDMRFLHTVDLGENQIFSIDEYMFRGMDNLYGLRLIGNQLRNLSKSAFRDLPKLQILNLAKNQIDYIEPATFEMVKNIQAIRLDGNRLRAFGHLFKGMPNLLWLNMSDNQLREFDYSQIPTNLQWLDLHKNELTDLKNDYQVNNLRLQSMDVSFNFIERIGPNSIPNSVELVFLNDNQIRHIEPHTFINKENLTRCDLYANHLQALDVKALRILPIDVKRSLPEFYIGGNPFVCDCNIEWLQKINQQKSRQYPVIMDLDKIYCKLLYNRDHSYIPLLNAETENFLCEYKTHCFALCHCCEFDACDCEMTCPNNCTCFHDQSWSTNIVDCSATGSSVLPAAIPMDTTELYLDGNNFSELSGHTFIGRKNLKILYANSSNINVVYNTTFIGLKRLRVLHLEDNSIQAFHGNEFASLDNLMELYLQNNVISYIEKNTFAKLKKLQILRLDNNQLVNFEIWQFQLNPYIVELTLSQNLWTCECSYLTQFVGFVNMNAEKITDNGEISCLMKGSNGNTTKVSLREKNLTKCVLKNNFSNNFSTIIPNESYENFIPLLLVATCTFVGFFGLIIGMFCYRNELRLWTHSNCFFVNFCYKTNDLVNGRHHGHHGGHLAENGGLGVNNLNKKYFYDAYVTYSLQDEHFINQILIGQMEQSFGYQLLMHYRDFNLNTYVIDTIVEAMELSKTTIVMLTKNFLYNEWSRFEFKSALHEIAKRRKKLVFIVYGDVPKADIDQDLQLLMRSNVCIDWHDKKFWNKLRLALPAVRKINNGGSGTMMGGAGMIGGHHGGGGKHMRSTVNIYATANDYNTTMRRINDPIPPLPPAAALQGHHQHHPAGVHAYATIANYGRTGDSYEVINNGKYNTQNMDRRNHHHMHPQPSPYEAQYQQKVASARPQHEYAVPCLLDESLPGNANCDSSMISTSSGSSSSTMPQQGGNVVDTGANLMQMAGVKQPYQSQKFAGIVSNSSNNNSNESLDSVDEEHHQQQQQQRKRYVNQKQQSHGRVPRQQQQHHQQQYVDSDEEEASRAAAEEDCSSMSDNLAFRGSQRRVPPVPVARSTQQQGSSKRGKGLPNSAGANNNSAGVMMMMMASPSDKLMMGNCNNVNTEATGLVAGVHNNNNGNLNSFGNQCVSQGGVVEEQQQQMMMMGIDEPKHSDNVNSGVAGDVSTKNNPTASTKCIDRRLPQALWA